MGTRAELLLFVAALPVWVVLAKLYGLYDRDEERADHSTADELTSVLHMVTLGVWLTLLAGYLTGLADPTLPKVITFWAFAVSLVTPARAFARTVARRRVTYLQNAVIVGAGEVGQLVARKLLQHREYGINLVGFIDADPLPLRAELGHVAVLGAPERLPAIVRLLDVERVIIAFSSESHERTLELIRSLKDLDVQIDIVPRLYEIVGPNVGLHTVEGLPLVTVSSFHPAPLSRLVKRGLDVVVAGAALVALAPFFALVAVRIKRDSPGPVFFRQQRLGQNLKEFTLLKFRTMRVGTDDREHREFVSRSMDLRVAPTVSGIYKLDRDDSVTRVGQWLRRSSLDELPQLINVLRGEMSLVGPRPCIQYEVDLFEPHHFERFLVPPGMTGLWQVRARALSTFREALDMDVAYARSWSLGLDIQLLLQTPKQVLRQGVTA